MIWSRRRTLLAAAALIGVPAGAASLEGKRIALKNLHSGERVDVEYFRNDAFIPEALRAIEGVLRDFRNGEQHAIDPALINYLVDVADTLGRPAAFSVISGYRSPQTNAQLRQKSNGVSEHSLHMQGRAIDVRMQNVDCAELARQAESLQRGGVGYYRASNFVHLDTGRFRTWRG